MAGELIIFVFILVCSTCSASLDNLIDPEKCGDFQSITQQYETISISQCELTQDRLTINNTAEIIKVELNSNCSQVTLQQNIVINGNSNTKLIYLTSDGPQLKINCDTKYFEINEFSINIAFYNLQFINCYPGIKLINATSNTYICKSVFDGKGVPTVNSGINAHDSNLYVYNSQFKNYITTFNTNNTYDMVHILTTPNEAYNDTINGGVITAIFNQQGKRIRIVSSIFTNNICKNYTIINSNRTLNSWAKGGAIFLLFKGNTNTNQILIEKTTFDRNNAGAQGGGVAAIFDDNANNNTIRVSETNFTNNIAGTHGGGMHVYFDGYGLNNGMYFNRCLFEGNYVLRGGGGFNVFYNFYFPENEFEDFLKYPTFVTFPTPLSFLDCKFINNSAFLDAAAIQTWAYISYLIHPSAAIFENCQFINNHCNGYAAILASGIPLVFKGETIIKDNSNSALYLTHASVHFQGTAVFDSNTNTRLHSGGGAMRLFDGSYAYIDIRSNITFFNNTAYRGPAIYIDTGVLHSSNYNIFLTSDCTIQIVNYDKKKETPEIGVNVFLYLSNNSRSSDELPTKLTSRGDIFITNLDDCYPGDLSVLLAELRNETNLKTQVSIGNMKITIEEIRKYIQTDPANIISNSSDGNTFSEAYPGKHIPFPKLSAVDQIGDPTTATLFLQYQPHDEVDVYPDLKVIDKNTENDNNDYILIQLIDKNFRGNVTISLTTTTATYELLREIIINITDCPAYLVLNKTKKSYYRCDLYQSPSNDPNFIYWDVFQSKAYLKENFWLGFYNKRIGNETVYIQKLIECPESFCECHSSLTASNPGCEVDVRMTEIDNQCAENRKGSLCGECKKGTSVGLKTLRCRPCSPFQKAVGFFVGLIDIIVCFAFCVCILWWDIKYKAEFAGFIFYVQVVAIVYNLNSYSSTLFLFFWFPYNYYSGNAFFEVILDPCTGFNDFTAIEAILYQYNYFVISFTVLIIYLILSRSSKLSSRFRRNFLNGFVFLAIFTYVTYAQGSFNLLAFKEDENGSLRYAFQPSINYYYIVVPGIFLVMFAFSIPILFVVFSYGYFPKLQPLTEVLRSPYKARFWWWTGFDLFRRIPLIGMVVFTPLRENRNISVCITCLFILVIHSIVQPYKKKWVNYLESALLMDIFIMSAINLNYNLSGKENPIYYDLIFIILPYLYAVGLIIFKLTKRYWPRIKPILYKKILNKELENGSLKNILNETLNVPLIENCSINDVELKENSSIAVVNTQDEVPEMVDEAGVSL